MKLKDIILNVDKSEQNTDYVDLTELGQDMGLYDVPWVDDENNDLKAYWFVKWLCTDSWVGFRAIFFNDKFVGLSSQKGRKCDIVYEWSSMDTKREVYEYLLSKTDKSCNEGDILDPDDLEVDWKSGYVVSYGSQLLTRTVYYENELVEIIKTNTDYGYIDKWRFVNIEKSNGETLEVNLIDVTIPFHLKK